MVFHADEEDQEQARRIIADRLADPDAAAACVQPSGRARG